MCIDRVRCDVLVIAVALRSIVRACFVVVSLCVVLCCESVGSVVRSFACVALRAFVVVLVESANDISPIRAIPPKRVLFGSRYCIFPVRTMVWMPNLAFVPATAFVAFSPGLATMTKTQK